MLKWLEYGARGHLSAAVNALAQYQQDGIALRAHVAVRFYELATLVRRFVAVRAVVPPTNVKTTPTTRVEDTNVWRKKRKSETDNSAP